MAGFTSVFAEQSVGWLLIVTVVTLVAGFLSSWLTYYFVRRQEIEDEGKNRQEVESYLGDESADREYRLEARKRLYRAIGPLKFQLIVACRKTSSWIDEYGRGQRYSMTMKGSYGLSRLYRLILPLAIAELIEYQVAYADFSVDETALLPLKFKRRAYIALTDSAPIFDHKDVDWRRQRDHLFSGTLTAIVNDLIVADDLVANGKRPLTYAEFCAKVDSGELNNNSPLVGILNEFNISRNSIFWARLVCLGFICHEYVRSSGQSIGFEEWPYDTVELLSAAPDEYILANLEGYQDAFARIANIGL